MTSVPSGSGGWHDIATAPKDSTSIGGWIVHKADSEFDKATGGEPFERFAVMWWDDGCANPGWERPAGWHKEWIGEPSHWMPLPEGPISQPEGGER